MADITPEETAYIRAKSGDDCTTYVVSAALLQIYWNTALFDAPTTIVSVLEDRWAKAKADVGRVTDFGSSVDRANMDHIEDLLRYWRGVAGIGEKPLAPLSFGVIGLGIDSTEEDLEELEA